MLGRLVNHRLFIVIAPIGVGTGVTLLVLSLLSFWEDPAGISDRSLDALSAWSAYALALLAGLAGWFAWLSVREQRRTRLDSLMPVVRLDLQPAQQRTEEDFSFAGLYRVRAALRNVGPGPARSIKIRVWIAPVRDRAPGIPPAPPLPTSAGLGSPFIAGTWDALGPADEHRPIPWLYSGGEIEGDGASGFDIYWEASSFDVFDRTVVQTGFMYWPAA